jgi:cell wall-associated NlpC family hydrolase
VRAKALVGTFSALIALAAATPALAQTGGTLPGSSTAKHKHRVSALKKALLIHGAPVTAKTIPAPYRGPVYEEVEGQVVPYQPPPKPGQVEISTGGSPVGVIASTKPDLLVPGSTARILGGLAAAPMSAPPEVQEIVWAGNQIVGLPYIYGGGHASFDSPGYDCSGTVSYALHGASLISTPMDSSEFMGWGAEGVGRWVTIFTNPGHAYMTVAGLRLDTSPVDDPSDQQGPRWRPLRPENGGFLVRHPPGF